MRNFYLLSLTLISLGISADISPLEQAQIEERVSSMGVKELQDRRTVLLLEQSELLALQQSGDVTSAQSSRLASIGAELSLIQKVLIGVLGVGAISAIQSGLFQMSKSGGSKRVLSAISKLQRAYA